MWVHTVLTEQLPRNKQTCLQFTNHPCYKHYSHHFQTIIQDHTQETLQTAEVMDNEACYRMCLVLM